MNPFDQVVQGRVLEKKKKANDVEVASKKEKKKIRKEKRKLSPEKEEDTKKKGRKDRSRYVELLEKGGARIVAPMVGGSELAFRVLCRKYGADVAYTPMLDSHRFVNEAEYREQWLQTSKKDWPLIVHFSGNDAKIMARASLLATRNAYVDGIDLNLGCPQRVAYSGHFGSYLLGDEDRSLVLSMVEAMRTAVPRRIAICVKIRLLDEPEATLRLVSELGDAGADVVAIHGRKRATWHKRGPGARDGPADLKAIKGIVDAVRQNRGGRPYIVTNGNVRSSAEADEALKLTGAAGVMSAEAILNDPSLFRQGTNSLSTESPLDLCRQYLHLVKKYGNPAGYRSIAFHCRRMCAPLLEKYELLDTLLSGSSLEDALATMYTCLEYENGTRTFVSDPKALQRAATLKKMRTEARDARRRFEGRMARKAKRENKPLDFYLTQGATPPTTDELNELRALADQADRLERWKSKFSQVCFNFFLNPDGCSRGETCAFLHAPAFSPGASSSSCQIVVAAKGGPRLEAAQQDDDDDLLVSG